MRRLLIISLGVALLVTAVWTVRSAAAGSDRTTQAPAGATATHQHSLAASGSTDSQRLAGQLAVARLATARYATNLHAAKAAGYQIITRMIPDMGWHYRNPTI
ncbi:MAG TPA: hypothetical protein VGC06_13480, partial [Actinomycetes bacterium]